MWFPWGDSLVCLLETWVLGFLVLTQFSLN